MKPTPLSIFLLKILKFKNNQSEQLHQTCSSVNQDKIIDMSTGCEEKEDDSKWMPPDQKYRQNTNEPKKLLTNKDIKIKN